MMYDSDAHLSLDSRKMRNLFEESNDTSARMREQHLTDEYTQGFRRLKNMHLDENLWQDE